MTTKHKPRRLCAATERALALIGTLDANGKPITRYAAARLEGIALSTIYNAVSKIKGDKKS